MNCVKYLEASVAYVIDSGNTQFFHFDDAIVPCLSRSKIDAKNLIVKFINAETNL